MGLDQYILQSSSDADVLNTINAIIDIDFKSGQMVAELTYLRGYHSLHDYFKWVVNQGVSNDGHDGSAADVTFFPAKKEELKQLIGVDGYDYSTIQNETFTHIDAADLITYRDFCWRVMNADGEGTIWDDNDDFYVQDFEAESIYEQLSEALDGMDSNLKLYYYASF